MINNSSMISSFQPDFQNQSKQRFEKADTDGNGEISKAEFSSILGDRGLSETKAEKLFTKLDQDNSGSISTQERDLAVDQVQQRVQKLQSVLASGFNQPFDSVGSLMERLEQDESTVNSDVLKQKMMEIREALASRRDAPNDFSVLNSLFPEIDETV